MQNTFNELNVIVPGHRYGVPAKLDPPTEDPADVPAVQIPHPWTRSVNGVVKSHLANAAISLWPPPVIGL